PDMGVRVSFLEERAPADANAPAVVGVSVPAEAVVQRDGRSVAFVVREGRAAQRSVEAGETRDGRRRISRGLAVGEQVVLSPPAELADEDKVVVES
ncbi:MAG: efflux RND transporter periplasmic adaptor subunit, partial [Pseudoxanthomonas sp.]|nr:efflux RND transporter periplasmic adaptor subunit [Pseudoxanthomonas sp.]